MVNLVKPTDVNVQPISKPQLSPLASAILDMLTLKVATEKNKAELNGRNK